jgi:NAD-dependent deacetylase
MNITLFTGAGMSVESGVPTFRGANGIYTESGRFLEVSPVSWFDARGANFEATALRMKKFLGEAREFVDGNCNPNAGHTLIAKWQSEVAAGGNKFSIITTNVDNLHERAGADTIKIHGDLFVDRMIEVGSSEMEMPDVVLFGEEKKRQKDMWNAVHQADVFAVIGSSLSIFGDSSIIYAAKERGARTFEINPNPTGHPAFDVVIPKSAAAGVQELYELLAS